MILKLVALLKVNLISKYIFTVDNGHAGDDGEKRCNSSSRGRLVIITSKTLRLLLAYALHAQIWRPTSWGL